MSVSKTLLYASGASTVTSNAASYFQEYQSMFTVGVSVVTCVGFVVLSGFNLYFKIKANQREIEKHNLAMEKDG